MEQQHSASVLLSLNMSQFSNGTQQMNQSNNNNNNSTTNLQQLHDHSSSSPPHSNNNNNSANMTISNSATGSVGHFNSYNSINNNNSQQQNYQNLYNFDSNQYIFSSTGNSKCLAGSSWLFFGFGRAVLSYLSFPSTPIN